MTSLLSLPDELLVPIIASLPLRGIAVCYFTCQRLRDVIKRSQLLRAITHTLQTYMEDLSPDGLSTAGYRARVEAWEKAWITLTPGSQPVAKSGDRVRPFGSTLVTQGGYLVEMHSGLERRGWCYADMSATLGKPGVTHLEWTNIDLGREMFVTAWALDVHQDIVAVASTQYDGASSSRLRIGFLQFTTGAAHESAIPEVLLDSEGSDGPYEIQLEIVGNRLVVLFTCGTIFKRYQRIWLVDWHQGRADCLRRETGETYFPALTFISNNMLVLARKRDWALEVCKIRKSKDGPALQTLCIFKLPTLSPGTLARLRTFRRQPSSKPSCSVLPFRSAPFDAVLSYSVTLHLNKGTEPEHRALFFYVLPRTLRMLVNKRYTADQASHTSQSHTLQWGDWGPPVTRWIEPAGVLHFRQALVGLRAAFVDGPAARLRVLDFSDVRARHVIQNPDGTRWRLAILGPGTIDHGRVFLEDVLSSLPYSETGADRVGGHVVIDDAWLVKVRGNEVGLPITYSVGVYSIIGDEYLRDV
ncbi:hypothetical protein BC834DRAFT_876531 [Gloeopeniophorella convolvens]|nr:hypothetical protein BC834DRAFT_876531 [Gloeopeniophorella convolvens]